MSLEAGASFCPPMDDDVPLLSQDEFFRHLELQSVHSRVKFTYRQALKERLRATTKKSSLNLPTSSRNTNPRTSPPPLPPPPPPPPPNNNKVIVRRSSSTSSSPKWLLSPKSCRRLFGRPKIKREKIERKRLLLVSTSRCDSSIVPSPPPSLPPKMSLSSSSSSILGPLINNCHLYRHPKVSEEIEQFSLEKKRLRKEEQEQPEEHENRSSSRPSSHIIQRIDFDKSAHALGGLPQDPLREPKEVHCAEEKGDNHLRSAGDAPLPPPADPHRDHDKEYEARIRIQPEVKTEDLDNASPLLRFLPKTKPPPPPPYLNQPRKLSQIPHSSSAIPSSSSSNCTSSPSDVTLKSDATQILQPPPKSSPKTSAAVKLLSHKCRHCSKMFSSRNALAYHEDNGHTTCRMCRKTFKSKWKKSKAMHICQDCVRRFPNSKKEDHMPLLPLIGLIQKQVLKNKSKISTGIKCDICPRSFPKRSHMIKHVLAAHASEMHRVNLEKFQSCLSEEQHAVMGGKVTL